VRITIIVVSTALLIWAISCLGIGLLALVLAGGYLKSPFEAVPWMLRVTLVPTFIAAIIIARIPVRFIASTANRHLTAIVTGYIIVVLIGSVFTVIDGVLRFGGVNAWGYFVWSWVYALILLPISYPGCLLLLRVR
jgi:hypothetical protein